MRFSNPYWSEQLKISTLQRWILVHSHLYYNMSESLVPDKMFDDNAHQLVAMQKDREVASKSQYWYVFDDFDGSTGFDLFDRLNDEDKDKVNMVARHLLKTSKGGVKGANNRVHGNRNDPSNSTHKHNL